MNMGYVRVVLVEADALLYDVWSLWRCVLQSVISSRIPDDAKGPFFAPGIAFREAAKQLLLAHAQNTCESSDPPHVKIYRMQRAVTNLCQVFIPENIHSPIPTDSLHTDTLAQDGSSDADVRACVSALIDTLNSFVKELLACVRPFIGSLEFLKQMDNEGVCVLMATNNLQLWEHMLQCPHTRTHAHTHMAPERFIHIHQDPTVFSQNVQTALDAVHRMHAPTRTENYSRPLVVIAHTETFAHLTAASGFSMFAPLLSGCSDACANPSVLAPSLDCVCVSSCVCMCDGTLPNLEVKTNSKDEVVSYPSRVFPLRLKDREYLNKYPDVCTPEGWGYSHPLVQPRVLSGLVVKGFGRGSKLLGIPTANMQLEKDAEFPQFLPGVYCGWATLAPAGAAVPPHEVYKMVMSVGYNPYFVNTSMTIEPYLFHEFPEDFPGSPITISLCALLRGEASFPCFGHLIQAIQNDCDVAYKVLDDTRFQVAKQLLLSPP